MGLAGFPAAYSVIGRRQRRAKKMPRSTLNAQWLTGLRARPDKQSEQRRARTDKRKRNEGRGKGLRRPLPCKDPGPGGTSPNPAA